MNEIEKMYKNAGVGYLMYVVDTFPPVEYPQIDFTAEKQLSLIKWLIQNKRLCIHKAEHSDNFYMDTLATRFGGVDNSSFEECLASMLNLIWQDLTEEERKQIADILKG